MNFLYVFIGGGLGSICRYGIALLLKKNQFNFPFATLIANIIACIILGYLIGLAAKDSISMNQKLLLMTGFCGGFSTFSTFSAETFLLFENGNVGYALANIGLSIIVCLVGIWIGWHLSSLK